MLSGFLLTLAVGFLWSFVGLFFKAMEKWKLSVCNISLVTNVFTGVIILCFVTDSVSFIRGTLELPDLFYILFMTAAGFINMSGSLILQRSMLYGKSSSVWAIGQSALMIPFISITLIYSESWTFWKISGTLAVLCGMFFLSRRGGKDDAPSVVSTDAAKVKEGILPRGILLALYAFLVLGIAQSMTAATSHFSYIDKGSIRQALMVAGSFCALLAGKIFLRDRGFSMNRKALMLIIFMAVENSMAFYLQFKALDELKSCGMSGLFYPVAVGTCIGCYSLWSYIFLREKWSIFTLGGTLSILTGIVLYPESRLIQPQICPEMLGLRDFSNFSQKTVSFYLLLLVCVLYYIRTLMKGCSAWEKNFLEKVTPEFAGKSVQTAIFMSMNG